MGTLKTPKRVLVVDDHPIVREGLRALIAQELEFVLCGEASGVEDGLREYRALRPDVVVVDIALGTDSGLELIMRIREDSREVAILALSMLDEVTYAERALRHGADGYVMKSEATDRLIAALHRVVEGRPFLSTPVADRLLAELPRSGGGFRHSVERLTDRELEIFRLVGLGIRSVDIARKLGISPKTIETHRGRIKAKLGVDSASELVIQAATWVRDGRLKA